MRHAVTTNFKDVFPTIDCSVAKKLNKQLENGGGYLYIPVGALRRSASSSGQASAEKSAAASARKGRMTGLFIGEGEEVEVGG